MASHSLQRKMGNLHFQFLCLISLAALALSACSGAKSTPITNTPPPPSPTPVPASATVVATTAPTGTTTPTLAPTQEVLPTWSRPKFDFQTPTPTASPAGTAGPKSTKPAKGPATPTSPPANATAAPTSAPAATEALGPTPTKVKGTTTNAIGEVTDLGSGSPSSTVSVYINGSRLMVSAAGFAKDAVILVRMRAPGGGWSGLGRFTIAMQTSSTYGLDIPTQFRGQSPLEVCLRNTRTSDQNCYSVYNGG